MTLLDVPRGSKVKVLSNPMLPPAAPPVKAGDIVKFSRIDGIFSECFKDGERVYLGALTEVEIVE